MPRSLVVREHLIINLVFFLKPVDTTSEKVIGDSPGGIKK